MTEPDFGQIAQDLGAQLDIRVGVSTLPLIEALRQVWNDGKAAGRGYLQEGGRVVDGSDAQPVMLTPGTREPLEPFDAAKIQYALPLIDKLSDTMDRDGAAAFVLSVMCQVWNARGAADAEAVKEVDFALPPREYTHLRDYSDALTAIKALDR